jgi:hypothetical protein
VTAQEKPQSAQQEAQATKEAQPAKDAEPAKEAETAQPEAETAAPATEPVMNTSIEVGYRWVGSIRGNPDVYRSVVNLGEGPRLLNLDFSMSPSAKWIDALTVRANSWGGDPYNTASFRAEKQRVYRIEVDYRNIAYFNALPSFANPDLERGILRSQRTFDITRRYTDLLIEARPGTRIIPFFGYTHDAGFGRGVTTFVPGINEYPVSTNLDDRTDTFRGGVRIETSRAHVTVEQGLFQFSNDERVFTADRNLGNRPAPFLGQTLFLQNVTQQYSVEGDAIFSRVYATANPVSWLDLYGNFVFTQPKNTTAFNEQAAGLFATQNPVAFFPTSALVFDSIAKQPHTRGSFGFELRPVNRVRVIHSWMTDRLHTAVSGSNVADRLEMNYSHNQIEGLVEVTDRLTLRGGHRYSYGDARTRRPVLSPLIGLSPGNLDRKTWLGGVSYRAAQRFSINVDSEFGSGESAYFRTSLLDYQRVRLRARYQVLTSLGFTYTAAVLNNDNPHARSSPGLDDYDALTADNSFGFFWTPNNGQRVRVLGEYSRQTWRSDTLYLAPQDLTPERSRFRENSHAATLMVDFAAPFRGTLAPRFSAGGTLFRSTGSRPTEFYTPTVRVSAPIVKHMDWNAEWRWWGMSEPFYAFENFRNHQLTVSVRVY